MYKRQKVSPFQLDTIVNLKQNLDMIQLHTMNVVGISMVNAQSAPYKSLNATEPSIDFPLLSNDMGHLFMCIE